MVDVVASQQPVAALAVLRDGHRVVDGVVVPPAPDDPQLRVRRQPLVSWPLGIAAGAGMFALILALVPGLPFFPLATIGGMFVAPLVFWHGRRLSRWTRTYPQARTLLESGDLEGAELRLRSLAEDLRGDVRGSLALLDVAECRLRRGDLDGALAIHGELHEKRAFASKQHRHNAERLAESAAEACEKKGDEATARRWRDKKPK